MRQILLLIALLMAALAAIIVAWTTAPDMSTVLGLGFGSLAVYYASLLLGERFP